jgi:hypothetical protein
VNDLGNGAGGRHAPRGVTERAYALVDGALDRIFLEPFDIPTAVDFQRKLLEPVDLRGGATGLQVAGFVTAAMPIANRVLRYAKTGSKVSKRIPSARTIILAVAATMRLSSTVHRGVRELQLLASYLIARFRVRGIQPDRGLVRALTVSLYLDPDRKPGSGFSSTRAAGAMARTWIFRAVGTDTDSNVRKRGEAWIAAIDRLDLARMARERDGRDGDDPGGYELTSG